MAIDTPELTEHLNTLLYRLGSEPSAEDILEIISMCKECTRVCEVEARRFLELGNKSALVRARKNFMALNKATKALRSALQGYKPPTS